MNNESKRQELATRLVQREVYYCVSSLVSTLSTFVQNAPYEVQRSEGISWEEDILPLMEMIDYEEAGTAHINECDDIDELESMADGVGYWTDACQHAGYDDTQEYADSDGEMDTVDFQTWFDEHNTDDEKATALDLLREYIVSNTSDWEEFCRDNEVDTDDYRCDVYEHWIVSDWLAGKLKARGYVTGELCGLTIYGRPTTGQSMCLDHNMQEIALELWGDEE